ncbi:protein RNA-directed DNA methylation 3-like isoform X1 [Zingiber officinale]|uniref:protein RNA-directed DNA methylation 3-like isoform X1 n=1 Tax=Zingiber officinale TaxID=94328 RepID=UPI001C4B811F|nr:protein RNA-directed DNA methylation 3-like isoform X1 [Zingiber officinale]
MALKRKGKQVAGKAPATVADGSSSGKRKMTASESSNGGSSKRKRKRSGVLQFVDDVAAEADSDYESDGDLEMEEEDEDEDNFKLENEKLGVGKSHHLPFLVKEEELSGDELEELIKERYGPGSEHVIHNDNPIECEDKEVGELGMPIWKVKCMVGREQQMAFCLMQKYVELDFLEAKLQIVSAFALEHVKGHVFFEADKLSDVMEACKGFCNIYPSRINLVPRNEVPNLLTSSNKLSEVSEGAWVRLKSGKYKGDLAKVMDVDDKLKQVTIKLIPRIDLQAIAKKFGGGISLRLAAVPAPRLISSHELEAFRPHIVDKRDRQTGECYEVLDGMMLKDGYLYKKVSIGSLISWGVQPTSSELLMFTEVTKHTDVDLNWFSSIYGTHKKKPVTESSEDKTTNVMENGYNLHDLVLFGRNNFGVIVAFEKDCLKILRGDAEGSEVMSVKSEDIKKSCDDKMFTASDSTGKTIFIKDIVKTSVGPSEGREGIVRHMYRGKLFIQVENELENDGFFCAKSNACQKTNEGKVKENLKFSSLESPTMPQDEENITHVNRGRRREYDHVFSIGQSLRIREGPLKGYLCRVVGIYRSDVTVKLDSLGKLITVKDTSLAVPRALGVNSSAHTTQELDNFGPQAIISAAGTSGETSRQAEKSSWESMVPSFDRDSWQTFSTPTHTGMADNKKGVEEDPWGSKLGTMIKNDTDEFGNTTDNWGKQPIPNRDEGQKSDPWASTMHTTKQIACDSSEALDGWGKATNSFTELGADSWSSKVTCADKTEDDWGKSSSSRVHEKSQTCDNSIVTDDLMKSKISNSNAGGSWDMEGGKKDNAFSWCSKGKEKLNSEEDTWSKPATSQEKINHSFDNRTTVEDGWETAKFSSSNADGSWDIEGPKKDNACSLDSKGKESLNYNDTGSQPAKFSISNAGGSWDMEGAKKENACSLDSKGKESLNNNNAWSQPAKSQEKINQICNDKNNVTAGWEMSKLSTNNAGGSWNMEGAKKDSACSWDSKEKGNSDNDCLIQAAKPQRNNESCHDQANDTDGWEKSKHPIDYAGGKSNACSWDSKGKVNSEDVWSNPANSQAKVDQICDASAGCWTQSDKSLHEKQKVRSEEDSWGKSVKPQVEVSDVWGSAKAEKVNWDSGNGSQVGGSNKNTNWVQTSTLEIDREKNDEDGEQNNYGKNFNQQRDIDGTTQTNWGRGRGRDGSKGSGGFNEVDNEQTWSSGIEEGRSRGRGHYGQSGNSRDDFHGAHTSAQVHSWRRDNGDSQTTAWKNLQSRGNESIAKDQTSTWANEKSAGKDKWPDGGDGKNDDEPGWNTVKASDTKQISGCINVATTKTEGNWDKARSDEAFDNLRKSSGIPNWDLAESSTENPKDVSLDKVSNWNNSEYGPDKSNSWDIKGKSKIAGDCWGETNYQERIDDVDNWVSNSRQIKESSTFPSKDQTSSWAALPLAGMAKDSTVQVSNWEKVKDSSSATETRGWDQARSSEHSEHGNWNRGNSFGEETGSDCQKKSGDGGYGFGRGRGRGQNNWDSENNQNNSSMVNPMGQGGYQRSSWGRGRGGNVDAGGDQQRPWKPWNDSDAGRGSGRGRGRGGNDDAGGDNQRQWKPRNEYDGGRGSGWGRGRGRNDAADGDQHKQWNRRCDSDAGWGRGRGQNNDAGGNQQRQWNHMNDSDESRGFGRGRFGSHDNLDGGRHGRGRGRGNNFGNNNGAGGRGPQAGFFSSGRNNDQRNFGDGSFMGNSGSKWGPDENKGCSTNWSKDQVGNSDNSKKEEKWGNANEFSSSQFSAWSNQPGQADLKVEGTWENSQDAPVAGDEGNGWGKAAGSWRKNEGSGSKGGW